MKDCLFCKIVKGEIPCYKIFEDENVLAFLDISKDAIGHTLVVPKKHFDNFLDVDSETLRNIFDASQKIANHFIKNCGFEGVNIVNNSGKCAGQSIMHFHVHIIPRKAEDGLENLTFGKEKPMDLEELCTSLKLN